MEENQANSNTNSDGNSNNTSSNNNNNLESQSNNNNCVAFNQETTKGGLTDNSNNLMVFDLSDDNCILNFIVKALVSVICVISPVIALAFSSYFIIIVLAVILFLSFLATIYFFCIKKVIKVKVSK